MSLRASTGFATGVAKTLEAEPGKVFGSGHSRWIFGFEHDPWILEMTQQVGIERLFMEDSPSQRRVSRFYKSCTVQPDPAEHGSERS